MTVADRIKALRTEKGITQTDLASMLGNKDKSTISKIESKGNDISLKDIKRIADALGTTPSYLMGWEDEAKEQGFTESTTDLFTKIRGNDRLLKTMTLYVNLPDELQQSVSNLIENLILPYTSTQAHKLTTHYRVDPDGANIEIEPRQKPCARPSQSHKDNQ